ncbi:MAG TPA: hypothetical protein VI299_07875 [Polyangiales bacterium]
MDEAPKGKRSTEAQGNSASAAKESPRDTVLIHGVSEDGEKLAVLRAREDRLEAGIVSKLKEGEPVHGELVRLTPRPESPLLCDVSVELPSTQRPGAQRLSHGGPAQVATPDYRANWDAIWSKKKPSSQLN